MKGNVKRLGNRPPRGPESADAGGPVVVTLLANGQYLFAQDGDPVLDPNGEDGLEWGTYSYDGSTISFTATWAR